MISELINNYGKLGVQGVLVILVAWLVWYLIRSIMGMFKNELKELHKDGITNARLNRKSINMQKKLINQFTALTEYLNFHFNGCVEKVNCKKKVNKKNGEKK
ncbi:hypothetical protein ES708_17634 [subsurface metagenome]